MATWDMGRSAIVGDTLKESDPSIRHLLGGGLRTPGDVRYPGDGPASHTHAS